jgi:N-methylhydantoinase A/oxoprolinase/acetone carboxylase beta subunit
MLGEVPLEVGLADGLRKAAAEARLALAAEDLGAGHESVVAFDGSLLWPMLHAAAEEMLLILSAPGNLTKYEEQAAGQLLTSFVPEGRLLRVALPSGAPEAVAAIEKLRPRAVGIALAGDGTSLQAAERALERAVHEASPGAPLLMSCDVGPLWGWSDRPLEKTAVSCALLPLVEDCLAGLREGIGDEAVAAWFASLDGTLIPAALALRHPYSTLRGLPLLSLSYGAAYGHESIDKPPVAAASVHEMSTAVAVLPRAPASRSFSSQLLGSHIESLGVGAESPVGFVDGVWRVGTGKGLKHAVTVREVLEAAGLVASAHPEVGSAAAADLAEWAGTDPDGAVSGALSAVIDAFRAQLQPRIRQAEGAAFVGPLAGAIAAECVRGLGGGARVPPCFGAGAALGARTAPRSSRAAESFSVSDPGRAESEVRAVLDELISLAVGDLEPMGFRRDTLAAMVWVEGARGAHGVYPALDREAARKAAAEVAKEVHHGQDVALQVEVYPAAERRVTTFRAARSPLTSLQEQRVVLPAGAATVLRVTPAGALSKETPTKGPALLSDPTGLVFVPEGFAARPSEPAGVRIDPL